MAQAACRAAYILGLIGAGLVATSGLDLWRGQRARAWPTTVGTVRSSRLVERSSVRGTHVVVEVRYDYRIGERQLSGDRVWVSTRASDAEEAEALARFRVGAEVEVHVDPSEPTQAVLVPGWTHGMLVVGLRGMALLALAGAAAAWEFRQRARRPILDA
jgi:hypothetical protein